MIAAFSRVPWLDVKVQPRAGEDGGEEAVVSCNRCGGTITIAITAGEYERQAADLQHRDGCPVPLALKRAHAARWN